jgi:hypothetical protein
VDARSVSIRRAGDASCHRFRSNEVWLRLSVIAYNLGNLWRRLVLREGIKTWSLTSLPQRLVKTGGRLVKHARYYWLFLAESHLTRRLFGAYCGGWRLCRYQRGSRRAWKINTAERGKETELCLKYRLRERNIRSPE